MKTALEILAIWAAVCMLLIFIWVLLCLLSNWWVMRKARRTTDMNELARIYDWKRL